MTDGGSGATPATEIARLVDEINKAGTGLGEEVITKIAGEFSRMFSLKNDEVAILQLAANGAALSFLFPFKLKTMGNIPMSTTSSLAVRTVRDKRPEMINNFSAQKHPTIFEAVKLDKTQQDRHPIQKIMSVPLLVNGKAEGAIQVSRKGKSATTAGNDFTIRDLTALVSIASTLAKCFKK